MHFSSKSGTYTVEALNNVIRHYLARFHRKTHCYSHSIEMVEYSILLLIYKDILLSMLC
ncbi:MAG: hypothetical protein LBU27_07260 [Candidatus Peribacteria bacterium]|nr:hypothetical protein [Candidatus Peribacteria bacterium]